MDKISVGDRVILNNKFVNWSSSPKFPVIGSEYECTGTIKEIEEGRFAVVLWDNGEELHGIKKKHLSREKDETIVSIW